MIAARIPAVPTVKQRSMFLVLLAIRARLRPGCVHAETAWATKRPLRVREQPSLIDYGDGLTHASHGLDTRQAVDTPLGCAMVSCAFVRMQTLRGNLGPLSGMSIADKRDDNPHDNPHINKRQEQA